MTSNVPRLSLVIDPVIGEAKRRAQRRRALVIPLLAGVVVAVLALTFALRSSPGGSGSPASSSGGFLHGLIVRRFASAQGIRDLRVLVSAGSGANSSAVIVGRNRTGVGCWTVVAGLGAAGGAFRCGTPPGVERGEPAAARTFRVGCKTSGRAGSATADAGSCIGFVGSRVARVEAKLVNGMVRSVPTTEGAFAYAGGRPQQLPVAFTAFDASGREVGHQGIVLASGLTGSG